MFLTGFDAKTLNTLWVDKNLKYHGLMQSFSRTNRILNSVKTFGNILCFRDLEQQLDDALGLFGDADVSSIVLLRSYKDYFEGYDDENGKHHKGYVELIQELQDKFVPGEMPMGENAQKKFIKLFGQILKARNILSSFDDFANDDMLTPRDEQDFRSTYIELYTEFRNKNKFVYSQFNLIKLCSLHHNQLHKGIESDRRYLLDKVMKKKNYINSVLNEYKNLSDEDINNLMTYFYSQYNLNYNESVTNL